MLLGASNTVLPAWLVLPIAGITMLVVSTHVLAIQQSGMPVKRRRIRTANGIVMLVVTAMLAYALALVRVSDQPPATEPAQAREFVLVWMLIIGLLGLVVVMAGMDAVLTMSQTVASRRALRRELQQDAVEKARKRAGGGGGVGGREPVRREQGSTGAQR